MKLTATFKTPGAIADAVNEAHNGEFETDYDYEDAVAEATEKTKKWVGWGELVSIEFDLEAGTATVKERS